MKVLNIILIVLILFCSQVLAQANKSENFCRYGYNREVKEDGTYSFIPYQQKDVKILPRYSYPWGICFENPSFIKIKDSRVFSAIEQDWTNEAMKNWNKGYKKYKIDRWGNEDAYSITGYEETDLYVCLKRLRTGDWDNLYECIRAERMGIQDPSHYRVMERMMRNLQFCPNKPSLRCLLFY